MKITTSQFSPTKGNPTVNLKALAALAADAAKTGSSLIVFPETATTGYFLEGGVAEHALAAGEALRLLQEFYAPHEAPDIDVVLGFYERHGDSLYNSALYARLSAKDSRIVHVHRKVFLPTYGVFDEARFVQAGQSIQAFETDYGRVAILICEDAWHSLSGTLAALDGATTVIIPAASPARGLAPTLSGRPENLETWSRLVTALAKEHGLHVILATLTGFEGGKAFLGGASIVDPEGRILTEAPMFETGLWSAILDPKARARAHANLPLLASLRTQLPHLMPALVKPEPTVHNWSDTTHSPKASVAKLSVDPLQIDLALTRRWLVQFVKAEVARRGFTKVVLGLSGGVDSALVAALATEALGPENVIAFRLPYKASSAASLTDADLVAAHFKFPLHTIDISQAVDGLAACLVMPPDARRLGNIMARVRMTTLFDQSAAFNALPIGTGNKTERCFGYFTWHADDSPPINPLGDLFKSQVWALARFVGVPDQVVNKPASADLVKGQTDEDDFGITYPKADFILHWLLSGYTSEEIVQLGAQASDVTLVANKLAGTHWKRKLPTTAMVSATALGEWYLRPVDY